MVATTSDHFKNFVIEEMDSDNSESEFYSNICTENKIGFNSTESETKISNYTNLLAIFFLS